MAMQNGWIMTRTLLFIGAIVVGAGLLIGGLYYVKDRGETARREEAIKVAESQLEEDSSTSPSEEDAAKSDSDTSSSSSGSSNSSNTASELPTTGPEMSSLVAISALTFAASSYIGSRRQVRRAVRQANSL